MRIGVIISGLLHVGILAWALVGIVAPRQFEVKPVTSIPVDLMTASEFTKIKAGAEKAKAKAAAPKAPEKKKLPPKAQKKPPEKKKPVKAKAKPKPKKKVAALPPKPADKPKAAPVPKKAKPKPKKKAKPKPKPKPKKKVVKNQGLKSKPSNKKFSSNRISALLNKLPDAAPQNNVTPKAPDANRGGQRDASLGRPDGRDETMSANEIDAFRAQIAQCWSPPVGGLGADRIIVKIRIKLRRDGTIERAPTVMNSSSSPFFQAAAESAARAIRQCEPYRLPPKKYSVWRDLILNFDPSNMYGG